GRFVWYQPGMVL
ncbi:putative membrane protein, partial [Vibrio parahaemolyticus V-223/04]